MTKASIGIVGAGQIASTIHLPVLRNMPSVDVAWIADSHRARARAVAEPNRIDVADPQHLPPADIVLLAIPLLPRRAYLSEFAERGTAVLAEKPLSISAAEHAEWADTYAPGKLSVGYQRRFYGSSQLARSIVGSGLFGRLREIRVSEGARVTRWGRAGNYQDEPVSRGGGIVKNLGCHSLDLVLWVTGAKSFEVTDCVVEWDGDTDRRATATLALKGIDDGSADDCMLHWCVSWLDDQSNRMEMKFDNASVQFVIGASNSVDVFDYHGQSLGRMTAPGRCATTAAQAFFLEWESVIDAFATKSDSAVSARSCQLTAQMIDRLLIRKQ